MCGVVGVTTNDGNAGAIAQEALLLLQHRGPQSWGMAFFDDECLRRVAQPGLFTNTFPLEMPSHLTAVIAHVRYATSGDRSGIVNAQPLLFNHSTFGAFALAHNGDTPKYKEERKKLESRSVHFTTSTDTEVIGRLIETQSVPSPRDAILNSLWGFRGAYALVFLAGDTLIACRDPWGMRPLSLGRLRGAWIVASETCAFEAVGAEFVRDIEPGEILTIKNQKPRSVTIAMPISERRFCSFETLYLGRPDSQFDGRSVSKVRMELGLALAREAGLPHHKETVIARVPDSGTHAAIGYTRGVGVPLSEVLIRQHHRARPSQRRSFLESTDSERRGTVQHKLKPDRAFVDGKWIVLVDDSVVRGVTMREIIRSLRAYGALGVSVLVASPLIMHLCHWGVDMKKLSDLIAARERGNVEAIRAFIGADELHYLSMERFKHVIGNGHCFACFDGIRPF